MRLDQLLVEQGLFRSREKAKRAVMAGLVHVDGQRVDKPGTAVSDTAVLELTGSKEPFVSRAGRKLDEALERFAVDVEGEVCLDVGASTGGFTDCLLQRGARRVYALDVGYGLIEQKLRDHPNVIVMERINARYLEPDALPESCGVITVDVSFISLVKVVPALLPHLQSRGRLLTLIKPQFEVGREQVGKGGIVRDESVRAAVIEERAQQISELGLRLISVHDCDTKGARGNREAVALFESDVPDSANVSDSGDEASDMTSSDSR